MSTPRNRKQRQIVFDTHSELNDKVNMNLKNMQQNVRNMKKSLKKQFKKVDEPKKQMNEVTPLLKDM